MPRTCWLSAVGAVLLWQRSTQRRAADACIERLKFWKFLRSGWASLTIALLSELAFSSYKHVLYLQMHESIINRYLLRTVEFYNTFGLGNECQLISAFLIIFCSVLCFSSTPPCCLLPPAALINFMSALSVVYYDIGQTHKWNCLATF